MMFAFKALLCVGGLSVTSQFCDGFKVAWTNDVPAGSAVLELCTIRHIPASSTELADWSFASVSNSQGRLDHSIADTFSLLWPGLECELASAVENTNGLIQVGTTGNRGILRIVDIPSGVDDVSFTARIRRDSKKLNICSIGYDGNTNSFHQVVLTDELKEYLAPATNAAQLVFYTNNKDFPPQFAEIRLISGYTGAFVSTNMISRVNAGQRTSWLFHHLTPGDYIWRIESRFLNGTPATFSSFFDVSLYPDDPPIPRGFTIRIM